MCELKEHQPSMTVEEQVENLKINGLIIKDEEYAKRILNNISYFRLIKGFSIGLKEKNSNYNDNITFETIVELYDFNTKFRELVFSKIGLIEIIFRSRIANYFSNTYGVLGYLDSNNFENKYYFEEFMDDVKEEIERNKRSPFVVNYQKNYTGGNIPFYALIEISSFGMMSKFYKNMLSKDKKIIAKSFNISYNYFESWIETFAYIRNICAHYGRLYNAEFTKKPKLYSAFQDLGVKNNRIFGTLICIKTILKLDPSWNEFVSNIETLIKQYPHVNISYMGFIDGWKDLLSV